MTFLFLLYDDKKGIDDLEESSPAFVHTISKHV